MLRKLFKRLFWALFFVGFLCCIASGLFLVWGYNRMARDLPRLASIEDYRPPAVSTVYDRDETVIAEFYTERRYPAKLKEVPVLVRNSFIAAEDATFYSHPGIDFVSILRALVKNLQTGSNTQGGSTITQQVVKNLLLSPKKDYKRKIKEAILSYRLEQKFTKDEILEIYLNQMFFGNTAYGIKAAARLYYHKELSELTLAESALLAGLLKAPSRYSPISNFERARQRQRYVLRQMTRTGFITREMEKAALSEEIKVYKAKHRKVRHAPYFVAEVRRGLIERFGEKGLDNGGYQVHTALDLKANRMAEDALRRGLREVDKRRGWRGPTQFIPADERSEYLDRLKKRVGQELRAGKVYPALVTEVSRAKGRARVDPGVGSGLISFKEAAWARKRLDANDRVRWIKLADELKVGDVIEISMLPEPDGKTRESAAVPGTIGSIRLDQTPEIEGAIVTLDPNSGKVNAMVGGYDYGRSVFNRVTQSLRQPGSAFKPVVYVTAIEGFGYTPSTIVYDEQRSFRVGDEYWTPANYDKKFLGPITLRTALEKSRNLASADIISRIGVDAVIGYARKMGISANLGRNLSLSLGSSEVSLLEMTRAYGIFAARGVLFDTVLVERIHDRRGQEIYNYEVGMLDRAEQVLQENSAFIIANMMKGVVQYGTGYRAKALGRPAAAKTGTSNDQMDAWFLGYTPDRVCGVWVGFDLKRKIGEKETGGRVAAPVWLYFMKEYLDYLDKQRHEHLLEERRAEAERLGIDIEPIKIEPLDFRVPEGVDPFWVDKRTGFRTIPGSEFAFYEYFIQGTEPGERAEHEETTDYLESSEL